MARSWQGAALSEALPGGAVAQPSQWAKPARAQRSFRRQGGWVQSAHQGNPEKSIRESLMRRKSALACLPGRSPSRADGAHTQPCLERQPLALANATGWRIAHWYSDARGPRLRERVTPPPAPAGVPGRARTRLISPLATIGPPFRPLWGLYPPQTASLHP